jgi:hypothetical protein
MFLRFFVRYHFDCSENIASTENNSENVHFLSLRAGVKTEEVL